MSYQKYVESSELMNLQLTINIFLRNPNLIQLVD